VIVAGNEVDQSSEVVVELIEVDLFDVDSCVAGLKKVDLVEVVSKTVSFVAGLKADLFWVNLKVIKLKEFEQRVAELFLIVVADLVD
jgi:hypothetical protein